MMTLEKFEEASELVKKVTNPTTLVYSEYLSEETGGKIYLKPENMQHTGAYKIRGAYYKISTLTEEEKAKGEDEVQLVFLLAIPEEMKNDSVLIQLYDNMLAIAHEPDVVKKLRQMKSYRELLLYFVEENNIFK